MVYSLLEEVGDTLGDFLMVDDESSNILHFAYACILVDIDVFKGIHVEILVKSLRCC